MARAGAGVGVGGCGVRERAVAMIPNLGRLRLCSTGSREVPGMIPGPIESTTPVFDELFAIPELRTRIFPNVLDKFFQATDPEDVCAQALVWMNLHPSHAAAARNNPGAWMRLVSGVFGAAILAPGKVGKLFPELAANKEPFPNYWQEVFLKLCGRYKLYLNGARRIHEHAADLNVFALARAAVTHDGMALQYVREVLWPEQQREALQRAAVQSNPDALALIAVFQVSRELVDLALAQDETAIKLVGSESMLLGVLRERPELLAHLLKSDGLPDEDGYLTETTVRTLLREDGSVFQYLPGPPVMARLDLALDSFPWALEYVDGRTLRQMCSQGVRSLLRVRRKAEQDIEDFWLSEKSRSQRSNRHYVTEVLRRAPLELEYVGRDSPLSTDLEIAWLAVEQDVRAIDHVDGSVLANPEFMRRFNVKYGSSNHWRARIQQARREAEEAAEAVNAMDPIDAFEKDALFDAMALAEKVEEEQRTFDWFDSHYTGWATR